MNTDFAKIGIREFREHLPHYLQSSAPVAITRHGETIGFYIPTRHYPEKSELNSLKKAAAQLDNMLSTMGAKEDEMLLEFRSMREK